MSTGRIILVYLLPIFHILKFYELPIQYNMTPGLYIRDYPQFDSQEEGIIRIGVIIRLWNALF